MKKRLLSLCLALVMCIGLLPLSLSADEPVYLALGDSITTGYRLAEGESGFATLVAEANGYELVNAAVNGATSSDLLQSLESGEIDPSDAELITITIGGNDLLGALFNYLAEKWNEDEAHADEADITGTELISSLFAGTPDTTVITTLVGYLSGFASSEQAAATLELLAQNLTDIVAYIKNENPDVRIVVATQYNPYSYFASAYGMLVKQISTIAEMFTANVAVLNEVITESAEPLGYIVADVYTAFEDAVAARINPCNPSIGADYSIDLDFHPNAAGHAIIADTVNAAINPDGYTVTNQLSNITTDNTVSQRRPDDAEDYTAVLTAVNGYKLPETLTITVDGTALTEGYTYDSLSGQLTIDAASITGDLAIIADGVIINPFIDISSDDLFYDDVMFVYENGLMNGDSATTFSPYGSLTRAQIATIIYRAAGSPEVVGDVSFTDVPDTAETEWYHDAVLWAQQMGVMQGYGDGIFGPADILTREQLVVIVYNYAKLLGLDSIVSDVPAGDLSGFADAASVSSWAVDAVQWAVTAGILTDNGSGLLDPTGNAARVEIAVMIHNFMNFLTLSGING
ncbi:MAG TPA: S-layer homology domain-containing protein [Firmicutes bacterium]|nr:S-layer homology domain-containing protein [Bacillota bacterium]